MINVNVLMNAIVIAWVCISPTDSVVLVRETRTKAGE
jgi:hypothetical protein